MGWVVRWLSWKNGGDKERECFPSARALNETTVKRADFSPTHRAWMRLPSGKHLDLLNPTPDAWEHLDLVTRLSRTYRWGGESCWPLPLSVAQHSLLVLEIRRSRSPAPLDAGEELQELLHDAEEGFLGFDCISPLKPILGEPFRVIEQRLISTIWERYQVPAWTDATYQRHKQADHIAAACEAIHCVGWSRQEVMEVLGITAAALEEDPLARRYGEPAWQPWPAHVAAERFHQNLVQCCGVILDEGRR